MFCLRPCYLKDSNVNDMTHYKLQARMFWGFFFQLLPLLASMYPSSCRHNQLCWGQQALFLSACAKNTPDKSQRRNLGQQGKDLIRTNVICRSMCGCVCGGGSRFLPSPPVATQGVMYLCVCVYCVHTPVWIGRCVPVCFERLNNEMQPRMCHPSCL